MAALDDYIDPNPSWSITFLCGEHGDGNEVVETEAGGEPISIISFPSSWTLDSGYVFTGWKDRYGKTYPVGDLIMGGGDLILTAQYDTIKWSITYLGWIGDKTTTASFTQTAKIGESLYVEPYPSVVDNTSNKPSGWYSPETFLYWLNENDGSIHYPNGEITRNEPVNLVFSAVHQGSIKPEIPSQIKAGIWTFNDALNITSGTQIGSAYGTDLGYAESYEPLSFSCEQFPELETGYYQGIIIENEKMYFVDTYSMLFEVYNTTDGWCWNTDGESATLAIAINETANVSDDFAAWFKANATCLEFPQINGLWKFKNIIALPLNYNFYQDISFESNGERYTNISNDFSYLYYDSECVNEGGAWTDKEHQYINFGAAKQTINFDFFNWFVENAEAVTALETPIVSVSGDILKIESVPLAKSYEVYINGLYQFDVKAGEMELFLTAGAYSITVKAKNDDLRLESDLCSGVEYISKRIVKKITSLDGITLATEKKYCENNIKIILDDVLKDEITGNVAAALADTETALDRIIALQNSYIGGDAE